MTSYYTATKPKINNQTKNIYSSLIIYLLKYALMLMIIIGQIIKPNINIALQNFVFDMTENFFRSGQIIIGNIEELISNTKNINIIQTLKVYDDLKNENIILKTKVAIQEKELAKANDSIRIINTNFGAIKNFDYISCSVSFYLNGYNKIIFCEAFLDRNVEIKRNSLVVNEIGLVGRVMENYAKNDLKNNIKIQLIDDVGFRIPIVTGTSFTRGVAIGSGYKEQMNIMYSDTTHFINKETAFTASDGNIIMPEIPVGNIVINEYGDYVIQINNKINNLVSVKIVL